MSCEATGSGDVITDSGTTNYFLHFGVTGTGAQALFGPPLWLPPLLDPPLWLPPFFDPPLVSHLAEPPLWLPPLCEPPLWLPPLLSQGGGTSFGGQDPVKSSFGGAASVKSSFGGAVSHGSTQETLLGAMRSSSRSILKREVLAGDEFDMCGFLFRVNHG